MEAAIPTEIRMPTLRTEIPEEANAEAVTKDLDMTDELRKAAAMRIASYQQRLANLYNRWVKSHIFRDRDLVLRRVFENTANSTDMKFQPNLERLYTVGREGATGSYALNKLDGTLMPIMWNYMHLKRYYQ